MIIIITSRAPVDGKSSVCVIYIKYRIIIVLIIVTISLDQILLSYISNTTHIHTIEIITHYTRMGQIVQTVNV